MSGRPLAIAALAAVAASLAAGCAANAPIEPPGSYAWTAGEDEVVRRVVLLPLHEESGIEDALPRLELHLAAELRKTGKLDVVVAPRHLEAAPELTAGPRSGRYETSRLVELRRLFSADAALVGVVTARRFYPPFALGVRLDLVSLRTGEVLWAMDATYDASDEVTLAALRNDHSQAAPVDDSVDSLYDYEACLVSRERFAQFVCRRIARSLAKPRRAAVEPPAAPQSERTPAAAHRPWWR